MASVLLDLWACRDGLLLPHVEGWGLSFLEDPTGASDKAGVLHGNACPSGSSPCPSLDARRVQGPRVSTALLGPSCWPRRQVPSGRGAAGVGSDVRRSPEKLLVEWKSRLCRWVSLVMEGALPWCRDSHLGRDPWRHAALCRVACRKQRPGRWQKDPNSRGMDTLEWTLPEVAPGTSRRQRHALRRAAGCRREIPERPCSVGQR